jgi:hypothetical protein
MTKQHFVLLVLWIYQFTWGLLLLLFIKSIVVPLLHRYPGQHMSQSAVQLFLAEGQFQLMKTDISHSYLWTLLVLVLVKMALTPIINAGIFYSIHNNRLNSGYRFFKGVKELGGTFTLYYIIQVCLTAAPCYWLYPILQKALTSQPSYEALVIAVMPWVIGLLVYGYMIHLSFLYLMLGRTTQASVSESIGVFLRHLPMILVLAGLLLLLSGVLTTLTMSASLLWAGLSALILHQVFHVLKMLFKLWAISTQYHYFSEHNVQ